MESVFLLIDKVFIRIKKEVQLIQEREKEDTIDLLNCLRIFMGILRALQKSIRGSSAASQMKHLVIQRILPALDLFEFCKNYSAEDEVVKVGIEVVNSMDRTGQEIQPFLKKVI